MFLNIKINLTIFLKHLEALEMQLLAEEIQIPVYFTIETPSIMGIYSDLQIVSNVDNAPSAFEGVLMF